MPHSDQQTVFLVDDDQLLRQAMARSLKNESFLVESFESAKAFLERSETGCAGCLILDFSMPGMNGLELQQELVSRGITIPIIFITGHGGVPQTVQAVKAGAIDFLEKPFQQKILLDRIAEAFEEDRRRREAGQENSAIQQRFTSLTEREHEVLQLLISDSSGLSSKQVARILDISPRTVDHHRARIMDKTQARSIAELVTLAQQVELKTTKQ